MNILFFILKTKLLLKRVFGKETEMRTLLGTMNEEIEKMKKAVNIDYAPVTLDKSDKKGLSCNSWGITLCNFPFMHTPLLIYTGRTSYLPLHEMKP